MYCYIKMTKYFDFIKYFNSSHSNGMVYPRGCLSDIGVAQLCEYPQTVRKNLKNPVKNIKLD